MKPFYNKILQNIGFKMLETNLFVILFYSRKIHVIQRDFEVLALVVYVGHRRTCDVTLFCVIRCFCVYSGAFAKHCGIRGTSI